MGIATQDPELRKQFAGKPEHLVSYFTFVAEEMREIMAELGFRTVAEMVGRTDVLDYQDAEDHWKSQGMDLSRLLHRQESNDPNEPVYCDRGQEHGLDKALDNELIAQAQPALDNRSKVNIDLPIYNSNRTVGAMLSGKIAKVYGLSLIHI